MLNKIKLPIKVLRDDVIIPNYAHGVEDSGMDLYTAAIAVKVNGEWVESDEYTLSPNETVLIKTGIAAAAPIGTELQVRPTSGNSLKTMLRVANAPGTIDAGYRNEIGVIITNTGTTNVTISKNDKIAQMVLVPILHADIQVVDELPTSDRGLDGYGSTGTIKDIK
jgi:dUTP pyrophosphatase